MVPHQDVGAYYGALLPLLQHDVSFKRYTPHMSGKGRISWAPSGHHVCAAVVELVATVSINAQNYLVPLIGLRVCVSAVRCY
jgi:hypothetical protein